MPDALAKYADAETKTLSLKKIEEFYSLHRNYILLESQQLLLEDAVVEAVDRLNEPGKGPDAWKTCPVLIYLADTISDGKDEFHYAVVAARGSLPGETEPPLKQDEIDLADWKTDDEAGSPLKVKPGDTVTISYYAPDDESQLQLKPAQFRVRKVFPLEGDLRRSRSGASLSRNHRQAQHG